MEFQNILKKIYLLVIAFLWAFLLPTYSIGMQALPIYSPDRALDRARELVRENKIEEALYILKPHIQEPLKYPALYSDYLVLLKWNGKALTAVNLFSKLPKNFPARPYLLKEIAEAAFNLKKYNISSKNYTELIKLYPTNFKFFEKLIYCYFNQNETEKAKILLNERLNQKPDDIELWLLKINLMIKQGHDCDVLALYDFLMGYFPSQRNKIQKKKLVWLNSLNRDRLLTLRSHLLKQKICGCGCECLKDLIQISSILKDYEFIKKLWLEAKSSKCILPNSLLSTIAWAFFKTGEYEQSLKLYNKLCQNRANKAHIWCLRQAYPLAALGKFKEANNILEAYDSNDLENLFARAYLLEQEGKLWEAVKTYNRILELTPSIAAEKGKLMDLSALGAVTPSIEKAKVKFSNDYGLLLTLKNDLAVNYLKWTEPEISIELLRDILNKSEISRSRFDLIVALVNAKKMEEAVSEYERLCSQGRKIPYWSQDAAGQAYIYLNQFEDALVTYEKLLKEKPKFTSAKLGKYYALRELRRWNQAEKILDELDHDLKPWIKKDGVWLPIWQKTIIKQERAWLLAYQDRLAEAEKLFQKWHFNAPNNIGFRNGLAHVWLWRGWPRKALEEFNIIKTRDYTNEDTDSMVGRAYTLNTLNYKKEARTLALTLQNLAPKDKSVIRLNRDLMMEQMPQLTTTASAYTDEDGSDDLWLKVTGYYSLNLHSRIFMFWLWNRATSANLHEYLNRAGLGLETRIGEGLWLYQAFSADLDHGDNLGLELAVNYNINDYWQIRGLLDSWVEEISVKARADEVEATSYSYGITWRESEWREINFDHKIYAFTRGHQSRRNIRNEFLLSYEQGLYAKHNWLIRSTTDAYFSFNTSGDETYYFNPDYDFSISETIMFQQTIKNIPEEAFIHRFFVTFGLSLQASEPIKPLFSTKYEQEHKFSPFHSLIWGAESSNRAYDGESLWSLTGYLRWQHRF